MQSTSATWKSLLEDANTLLETVAVINNTEYSVMSDPVITRALMPDGVSIGNVVSSSCTFSVKTSDIIPKSAEVIIKTRLNNGTTQSEWLPQGTFYISHRSRNPIDGILTFDCYDSLLKANAPAEDIEIPWTVNDEPMQVTTDGEFICFSPSYPISMSDLLDGILRVLGVELDSRTVIATGADYVINTPKDGATINDLLSTIGAANCGNWIITPENKLRLVPLTDVTVLDYTEISVAGTGLIINSFGASSGIIQPEDTSLVFDESLSPSPVSVSNATLSLPTFIGSENADSPVDNMVVIGGIYASLAASQRMNITGIRNTYNEVETMYGDDSEIVIDTELTDELAEIVVNSLIGITYQPYQANGAAYNPAAELGDYVVYDDDIASIIYNETVTYTVGFRGDLSAPEMAEIADEYPYVTKSQKLQSQIVKVQESVEELDDSLSQEGVFNRLTNNGAAQGVLLHDGNIYINASYIQTGTLIANLIKGGVLTLGGDNNSSGVLRVVNDNDEEIVLLNDSGANISEGSIVSYSADKQDRMMLNTGVLSFQGFLPSASSTVEEWRPYLNIRVNNTGSTIEDSVTQFFSAGAISISPGDLQYVQIIAATTNPAVFNILLVDHNGIHITGPLLISNGTTSGTGTTGSFRSDDGKTVAVVNGIIVSIT